MKIIKTTIQIKNSEISSLDMDENHALVRDTEGNTVVIETALIDRLLRIREANNKLNN